MNAALCSLLLTTACAGAESTPESTETSAAQECVEAREGAGLFDLTSAGGVHFNPSLTSRRLSDYVAYSIYLGQLSSSTSIATLAMVGVDADNALFDAEAAELFLLPRRTASVVGNHAFKQTFVADDASFFDLIADHWLRVQIPSNLRAERLDTASENYEPLFYRAPFDLDEIRKASPKETAWALWLYVPFSASQISEGSVYWFNGVELRLETTDGRCYLLNQPGKRTAACGGDVSPPECEAAIDAHWLEESA